MDESWRPVLQLFRIQGMDPESATLLLQGGLVALGVLFLLVMLFRWRRERTFRRQDLLWFYRTASHKNLTSPQIDLLRHIAAGCRLTRLTPLLTSLRTFDDTIARYLALYPAESGVSSTLVADLTAVRSTLHLQYHSQSSRLYSSRSIPPGYPIRLRCRIDERDRDYFGVLTGVDDAGLTVQFPDRAPAWKTLHTVGEVELLLLRAGDAEYRFTSRALQAVSSHPAVILLAHSEHFHRVQRRAFFRIPVSLDVLIWILDTEQTEHFHETGETHVPAEAVPYEGRVESLSGGGASLLMPYPVTHDALLSLTLILSRQVSIHDIAAQVIRARPIGAMRYRVSVSFLNVSLKDRERIIRHVMREERKGIEE